MTNANMKPSAPALQPDVQSKKRKIIIFSGMLRTYLLATLYTYTPFHAWHSTVL